MPGGKVREEAAILDDITEATANFQVPFRAHSWPVDRLFYLAESVLLPAYRDQGIGRAFFAMREAHIRAVSRCDGGTDDSAAE